MPSLFARQNPLDSAKTTFSSWDNCMAKTHDRWPVIVGIVIGGLILFSVIACIARCICCGAECACCCFRCCTCCCGGGGRSGHKRVKSDPAPTYPTPYSAPPNQYAQPYAAPAPAPAAPLDTRPVNQQYRSAPMPTISTTAPPERPQFATFDSTRAVVNEDALPAMPTWKDGRDVHVEVEEKAVPEKRGDMELNRLDHNGSMTSGSTTAMAAVGPRRSPVPARSPVSPMGDNYGFPAGYQNDSFVSAAPHRNSPGPQRGPYGQQDDYRRGSPRANLSPVHGAGESYGLMQNNQQGRQSPGQSQPYSSYDQPDHYNHNQAGQYAQRDNHSPQGQYDQRNNHSQQDQYDQRDYYDEPDHRYNSPAPPPQNNSSTHNYAVNNAAPYDNYAPAPARTHTPASAAPYDNFSPVPARTHTPASAAPYDSFNPAKPVRSNTSGYSPSESTVYEPSTTSAYPGQQTYNASPVYPGQQTYQAFQPGAAQGQQQSGTGVGRKPVDGMY